MRAKVTGQRRVSPLILKLWDIAWYIWNYRNNNLHASDGPMKVTVLTHANTRISYHFNCGTIGIATRCHFLFKTKKNILLFRPIRKKLFWLAAISSAQKFTQRPTTRINVYLSADQIFLNRVTTNHLITTLRKFKKVYQLRTTEGPDRTRLIFI